MSVCRKMSRSIYTISRMSMSALLPNQMDNIISHIQLHWRISRSNAHFRRCLCVYVQCSVFVDSSEHTENGQILYVVRPIDRKFGAFSIQISCLNALILVTWKNSDKRHGLMSMYKCATGHTFSPTNKFSPFFSGTPLFLCFSPSVSFAPLVWPSRCKMGSVT